MVAAQRGAAADLPSQSGADPDIRYLEREELEALLRAVRDDRLGGDGGRPLPDTAMTGLRQGVFVAG